MQLRYKIIKGTKFVVGFDFFDDDKNPLNVEDKLFAIACKNQLTGDTKSFLNSFEIANNKVKFEIDGEITAQMDEGIYVCQVFSGNKDTDEHLFNFEMDVKPNFFDKLTVIDDDDSDDGKIIVKLK